MDGMNIAEGMVSAVTEKLTPELKAWQQRPLGNHYPIVCLDAIHYKVIEEGQIYQQRGLHTSWVRYLR